MLIFYQKLPGNWGVVALKSPRSEWVNEFLNAAQNMS